MVITILKYVFSASFLVYLIVLPAIWLIQKGNFYSPFSKPEGTDMKSRKNAIALTLVAGIFIFFLSLYMNGFFPSDFLTEFSNSFYAVYILSIIMAVQNFVSYVRRKVEQAPHKILILILTSTIAVTSLILWISVIMKDFGL